MEATASATKMDVMESNAGAESSKLENILNQESYVGRSIRTAFDEVFFFSFFLLKRL